MKKLILIQTLLLSGLFVRGQVFIGTEPTGNPVILEVKSTNTGVLIPRINIPDTLLATPVTNPQKGLLVVNTHAGKEGLFFWNGLAWEKLKTRESVVADLLEIGKKSVFIGTEEKAGQELAAHTVNNINLKASFGALADKNTHVIQENGIYEITAGFTGEPSKANGLIALIIYNHTEKTHLAYTTVSQASVYNDVAAKAIYCGHIKKGDKIGLQIFYGTNDTDKKKKEKVKTVILSIKKIAAN